MAIRPFFDSPDLVKVVTGIRRAGKSVLLMQIADELRASGVADAHIIPINLEMLEFAELRSAKRCRKYYIADIGLLQAKRSGVGGNIGGRLENIVANELIARGYCINVGALRDAEIDFVAERNGNIEYIQVAYAINSDETAQREFGALDNIRDHYRKTVITTDTFDHGRNGIRHVNIIDWLLEHDSFIP